MRARILAAVTFVSLSATACSETQCDCLPCSPAITLRVVAADGRAPRGVEVVGAGGMTCAPEGTASFVCTSDVARAGTHALIVRAEGEADVALSVTVDAVDDCCRCGYRAIDRMVVLGERSDGGA